jgi:hypothetical protein
MPSDKEKVYARLVRKGRRNAPPLSVKYSTKEIKDAIDYEIVRETGHLWQISDDGKNWYAVT